MSVHRLSTPGLRYCAAISVAYGGGLPASAISHLQIGDIDSDHMLIRVDQGKGREDRHVIRPPNLREILRDYYRESRPHAGSSAGATDIARSTRAQRCRNGSRRNVPARRGTQIPGATMGGGRMTQSRFPKLQSPVARPLAAAISPKSPPVWASGRKKEGQSAISWQENRPTFAVSPHTVVGYAHQPMQTLRTPPVEPSAARAFLLVRFAPAAVARMAATTICGTKEPKPSSAARYMNHSS